MSIKIYLLFCLIFISSCSTPVGPGRVNMGNTFSIDPQIPWNASTLSSENNKNIIWKSRDNDAQIRIEIFSGIEDGEPLYPWNKEHLFKHFMAKDQIASLYLDTMKPNGQEIEIVEIKSEKIGPFNGFIFELKFKNKKEQESRGLVAGTILDERLILIQYTASKEDVFLKNRKLFKNIIASINQKVLEGSK